MSHFELYKSCYRLLRDNDLDQDDAYAIADAIWDLFMPGVMAPNRGNIDHDAFQTTTHRCPHCKRCVRESEIPEYDFYCPSCDEDFYKFEVK